MNFTKVNVLIVDDNPLLATSYQRVLRDNGHTAGRTPSPNEASMPVNFDSARGLGEMRRRHAMRPKPRRFKGSKAAKKASRCRA